MRQTHPLLSLISLCILITIWQVDTAGSMVGAPQWSGPRKNEKTIPAKKLATIFPKAKKFVTKNVALTPEKVASIEKEIGAKLGSKDLKPTFYIALNEDKKPMGLVLFVTVKGPNGAIDGGVGLDMNGKIIKVEVYKHKEASGIAGEKFLKQFIGKGIEDKFLVGEDVKSIAGQQKASQAVTLIPKKMLAMSYALFLKKPETTVAEDEPYDLTELMQLMQGDYDIIRDYFQTEENKEPAVEAAKQLGEYVKLIGDFEPSKNAEQRDEYTYFQQKVHSALQQFAVALEKEGISDHTKEQWQDILDLVNKAHLRFSDRSIDLDED